jgi:hypothetical protein
MREAHVNRSAALSYKPSLAARQFSNVNEDVSEDSKENKF